MEKRITIVESVRNHADNQPEKCAVWAKDGQVTYAELWSKANKYAVCLEDSGVCRGDRVIVQADQTVAYVVSYLAIHLIGGVIVGAERNIPAAGLAEMANSVSAAFVICKYSASDFEGMTVMDSQTVLSDLEKIGDDRLRERGFPNLEDSADILFTTGTTGVSKGVELSHKALVATAENLIYGCGYTQDTVLILPGPLNHANAIRKVFTTLIIGGTLLILDGLVDIKGFYNALEYPCEKIAACLPPAAIRVIFSLTRDRIGNYKDKIDFIESASAPLPEADKERLCQLLPDTRLYNNYGSSEAASVCMYDYNRVRGKKSCIGKAMPNSEIVIMDDNHKPIKSSANNLGFLACRGDVNMKGYVNAPELTKEVLIDGLVYTNDLGYIDEEGYVYTVGRRGDVINVGGLKVAPAEVESAALSYEGIDDCICIAQKDRITGDGLKLLVVMRENVAYNPVEIQRYLKERLESFKVPAVIEKVDKVERTYNGKLNRKYYQEADADQKYAHDGAK